MLTAESIVQLSATKWNGNIEVARSLCATQADTRVGIVLLLAAVTLQMANAMWTLRWQDLEFSMVGFFLSVALFGAIMAGGWASSKWLAERSFERVESLRAESRAVKP